MVEAVKLTRSQIAQIAGNDSRRIRWLESLQANLASSIVELEVLQEQVTQLILDVNVIEGDVESINASIVDILAQIAAINIQIEALQAGSGGEVTIDFGAFPGSNEAEISFSDPNVTSSSLIHAYIRADDSTTDHTASDRKYLGLFATFTVEPTDEVGGTVYARSPEKMQGTFKVRYVY